MAIEHKNITDPDVHEPKGISTSEQGTTYRSTGTGTGTWRKDRLSDISDLNIPAEDKMIPYSKDQILDFIRLGANGQMFGFGVTPIALTEATDPNLRTIADYRLVPTSSVSWTAGESGGLASVGAGAVTIQHRGVYSIDLSVLLKTMPESANVGVTVSINEVAVEGPRIFLSKTSPQGTMKYNRTLSSGDIVRISAASTVAGSIDFENLIFSIVMVSA